MNLEYKTVTVANGATLSSALDTNGKEVMLLIAPAALTGTTLTVKDSTSTTGTFNSRKINSDAISLTIGAGQTIQFQPPLVGDAFKFDTGGAEADARTLTIGLRVVQ
jgi:hypothetical protein